MYIAELKIENFRLFRNISVKFNKGLNLLVGENNSGKTALIDAIRITLDTNSSEWTRIFDFDFHENFDSFHIQIKFDGITPDQAQAFVEHLTHEEISDGVRKSVLYVNLVAQRTDTLRRGNRLIRTEFKSGKNASGIQIDRNIRDYLSATYLKPLRDAEAELSAGRGSRLSQILSSSKAFKRDGDQFKNLLEGLIAASKDAEGNKGIEENREIISTHFRNITFAEDKFELAIQLLGSKDFGDLNKVEKERAFMDILQRLSLTLDESKPFQGLGYNNALFMATELILLEQEQSEFPLLLIEEPEAHLHPQLQMKLLKFIRDEYSAQEDPKLQTFLSTHSPNLASKAPLESIILLKGGQIFPMRKGETGLNKDDYVFLEKFLDVTKANLFFAKAVLIVEGDAENVLLPTIAALLGRPFEDYGVSVVNVGSTANMRYVKVFLRNEKSPELPIKVASVRDLDLWPHQANEDTFPNVGFKRLKDRNHHYWLPHEHEGERIGTDPQHKKASLQKLAVKRTGYDEIVTSPQNIRVFVSEEWTFEYCLIRCGLATEIYKIITGSSDGYEDLPNDEVERAIAIYGMVEEKASGKTDVAYRLSEIITGAYKPLGNREALRAIIPDYILDAIEYVTKPFSENLDAEIEVVDARDEVVAAAPE
tara:strand:+ start:2262 stop:4214 length:1953 start_codon:yes stop_codon:yes gene_type:complete